MWVGKGTGVGWYAVVGVWGYVWGYVVAGPSVGVGENLNV